MSENNQLWMVDVNGGFDRYPMPDKVAAEDFVHRNQGRAGATLAVKPWNGTPNGHAKILALRAALA